MSTILAIDTSSDGCSAALLVDGRLFSRFQLSPRQHTHLIMPMIDEVVTEAGIKKSQIEACAFGAGPGSFTGLRISAGIAQGLAFGLGIPVIAVSTLEALAFDPLIRNFGDCTVAAAFDARMDEVYWGVYQYRCVNGSASVQSLVPDCVIKPGELTARQLPVASGDKLVGIGGGWIYQEEIVRATQKEPVNIYVDEVAKASVIAEIAQKKYAAGLLLPAHEAIPVYLRNEITWKKLPGR
jgi:tRNA threonylcarbamoyladenosine biosynthesis protein TsaB